MALPKDLDARLKVQDALTRALRLKELIDITESDIADIASTLNDEKVMKAKDFRELVSAAYEGKLLLDKANKKVADVQSALAEVDILNKVKPLV